MGFVTRLKANADCYVTAKHEVSQNRNIRSDETIEFHVFQAGRRIKGSYRRVKVWLEDKGKNWCSQPIVTTWEPLRSPPSINSAGKLSSSSRRSSRILRIKTFVARVLAAVHIQKNRSPPLRSTQEIDAPRARTAGRSTVGNLDGGEALHNRSEILGVLTSTGPCKRRNR